MRRSSIPGLEMGQVSDVQLKVANVDARSCQLLPFSQSHIKHVLTKARIINIIYGNECGTEICAICKLPINNYFISYMDAVPGGG